MLKYTVKRLAQSLVTILLIATIVFLLMRCLPTDYYFTEEQLMKFTEEQKYAALEAAGLTDKMNTLSAELAAKNEEIVNLTALKEAAESKLSTLQEKLQPMIEAFDTLKQSIADDSLWQSILKPFTDAIDGLGEIFSK